MNKFLSLLGRLCPAILLLVLTLVIHSCRKEAKLTQQQINAEISASLFPVSTAMSWFNGHKAALSSKIKINSTADFLKRIADFTPVWDSARTAVDTNYYVVEAPARYLSKIGFSTQGNTGNINGLTRLLILKSKKDGSLHAVLMQVHGDAGVDINNVHYMAIPKTFSGNIFYTTLQGLFYNGYLYNDGNIALVSAGKTTTTKPTGPQVLQMYVPGYCVETTTDWYNYTCYIETNGEIEHCYYDYQYTEVETYCVPGYYVPGGGGVQLPECPPGTTPPPVEAESVNGKKYINVAVPGGGDDGGDGGGTSPCVPVPPEAKINIDSLRKRFPCAGKLIIDKLLSDPAYSEFVAAFTTNLKPNLNWDDKTLPWNTPIPNSTSKNYQTGLTSTDGRSATIYLNDDALRNSSQLLIAATAIHETLHAYINFVIETSYRDNGFLPADYSPNASWITAIDMWGDLRDTPTNTRDHSEMIGDYFSKAISILKTWDSGQHTDKEYCEAMLFGLDNGSDGSPSQQQALKTQFDALVIKYGLTDADLSTFNTNNLNATTGKLPNNCN